MIRMKREPTVVLFHNLVAPYRHGVFRELARLVNLNVGYAVLRTRDRSWDSSIPDSYRSEVLGGYAMYAYGRPFVVCPHVLRWLERESPQAVISVLTRSNIVDVLRIARWCRQHEVKFVLWVGDVDKSAAQRQIPSAITSILSAGCRAAMRMADGFVSYSALTDQWLRVHAPRRPTVTGTQVLDPPEDTPRLAVEGRDPVVQMLFVGRHDSRKGLEQFAAALSRLPEAQMRRLRLVTVGDGPLRTGLSQMLPSEMVVVSMGVMKREEIYPLYRDSDLIVLPSLEDPWGFVINEAMSMGTPAAVSKFCGSSEMASTAGWVFDPTDLDAMTSTLSDAIEQCRDSQLRRSAVAVENCYRPNVAAGRIVDLLYSLGM